MKTNMLLIAVGVVVVVGLWVAQSDDKVTTNSVIQAGAQTARPEESKSFKVIGYLEKRDRVVTIKSGPNGTVYSVATKGGKVIHENLSAEQLKAQAPDVHDLIKTGVAGDATVRNAVLDARY